MDAVFFFFKEYTCPMLEHQGVKGCVDANSSVKVPEENCVKGVDPAQASHPHSLRERREVPGRKWAQEAIRVSVRLARSWPLLLPQKDD